jgi:hypothetical protein
VENPVNKCRPGISEKQRPYHADFDRDRKCSIRCHLRQAPPLSKHLISAILPYAEQFEFVINLETGKTFTPAPTK